MRPLALPLLIVLSACGSRPEASPPRPSIVVVTIAGLRADGVGALGGEQRLSPSLDDFFADAAWSGTALASSDQPESAVGSIFTGLSPWQHGAWRGASGALFGGPPTLAGTLGRIGYRTIGLYARSELGPASGLGRGFADYRPARRLRSVSRVLDALEPTHELIWIQLDTLLPPLELEARLLPRLVRPPDGLPRSLDPGRHDLRENTELRRQARALYELGVARADELFGRLLAAIDASPAGRQAVVVVCSDVGTDLGDRQPVSGRRALRRKLLEVPLAIRLPPAMPSVAAPRGGPVAMSRLFATLLELVGETPAPAVAPSLFAAGQDGVLSETYDADGANLFSLWRDGLQLQWVTAVAVDAQGGEGAHERFLDTPPLSGTGRPPVRWLERWTPGGGTRLEDDPERQAALEKELQRQWLLFQEEERTPRWQRRHGSQVGGR